MSSSNAQLFVTEILKDMIELGLDPRSFNITDPATLILVNSMKLLNNPETDSKAIVKIFEDFRGKYSSLIGQAPVLAMTVEYWYKIYSQLLEVNSTTDIKQIMKPLFDPTQDTHNRSRYNLGQSFMKASMHLLWKKLALYNPNIATIQEISRFKEDTPRDIVIGQIAFNKIFAEEIRGRGSID